MANIAGAITAITDAGRAYSANWRKIIAPFAVLAVIGIAFGLVTFGLGFVSEGVCSSMQDPYVLIAFCYAPQIMQNVIGIVQDLVGFLVIMAVLVPLWAVANGKPMGKWTDQLGKQFVNALKVIIVRIVIVALVLSPLIAFVALNIAAIIAVAESVPAGTDQGIVLATIVGSMGMIFAAVAVGIVIGMAINFLLTFFEIEMAVGGKGVFAAMGASVNLVMANFIESLVFNLAWWGIGIAVSVIVMLLACTVCLIPLAFLIPPLVVTPVMWLSKLLLWKEFGGGKTMKRAVR